MGGLGCDGDSIRLASSGADSSQSENCASETPATVTSCPCREEGLAPTVLPKAVTLRGRTTLTNGYIPENWDWIEDLTKPDDETCRTNSNGQLRRIGLDPMTIPPDVLTPAKACPDNSEGGGERA
jgi:hypothetical protein